MRIGITREASRLLALIQQGAELGVDIVPIPVTEIKEIPFAWPKILISNDPTWVIFTSANAVNSFFSRLNELNINTSESTQYAAIGNKTAQSLHDKGYKVSYKSPEPYGESFFKAFILEKLKTDDIVVYPRAKRVVNNPEALFEKANAQYFPIICYETNSTPLDNNSSDKFDNNDFILFTAPSAVVSFHEQFGIPTAHSVAIGKTTAARMSVLGWQNINVLPDPDINQILEFVKCR
jgi:uroporphyrinogen-III synthase